MFFLVLSVSLFLIAERGWVNPAVPNQDPQVLFGPPRGNLIKVPPAVLNLQDTYVKIVESVRPAVVNISSVRIEKVQEEPSQFFFGDPNDFFRRYFGEEAPAPQGQPKEYRAEAMGSGVIIDPAGYILTNNHVIQGADELTVTLNNEKKYKGKVIGADPRTDLAVVKINSFSPLPYVPLGNSSAVRVGEWVLAFGSPFGLQHTVTSGIISAQRQTLNIEGHEYRNLFQTDAAINRGNSGGPLVNLKGEIIGVNTAIYAPTGVFSGVGFAIPIDNAKAILADLIRKGRVVRSWMGVEVREMDEVMAKQFGLSTKEGALVNQVVPKSPAEKAGVKRGDVIIEFDGKKVTDSATLQDVVFQTPPQKKVAVEIIREGKPLTLSLMTEEMPSQKEAASAEEKQNASESKWLGATFSDITNPLLQKYQQETGTKVTGVIAVNVPLDSVAADAGIVEGDIIHAVNQKEVANIADFEKVTKDVNVKEGIVLDLRRQGQSFFLSYKSL